MAIQLINVGTTANSGGGDPLRDAMIKINENFTEVYADIAAIDPNTATDIKGSVFGDDSTLLVDGVSSTIPAANLSGTLPALDGSALTNISAANISGSISSSIDTNTITTSSGNLTITADNYVIIDSDNNGQINIGQNSGVGNVVLGNVSNDTDVVVSGELIIQTGTQEKFATLTGATGTVTHDCDTGHIFYHTTPAADWTANFTNLDLVQEYATTLSIVIGQGATAYIPSAVEIGGVAQTLLWQGGSQPSGTADGTDVVAFSILNDGGTYVVMGQLVGFS